VSGDQTSAGSVNYQVQDKGKYMVWAQSIADENQRDTALLVAYDVRLKSVNYKGSGNHPLRKQGSDSWTNDKFADDGNVAISYPEWEDSDLNGTADDYIPLATAENQFLVTYGTPQGSAVTAKRVDWASGGDAKGAASPSAVAGSIHNELGDIDPPYDVPVKA